jgi:peptide/nickel transport system substrate-binding protein
LRITRIVAAAALAAGAQAKTFRYAEQGDSLSMDPYMLNESLLLNFTGNMYEPLVDRGKKLELVPGLATSWKQTSPKVWRFELRRGVKFHDGTPFTADDVSFSYQRAKGEGSDIQSTIIPSSTTRSRCPRTVNQRVKPSQRRRVVAGSCRDLPTSGPGLDHGLTRRYPRF